MKVLHPFFALIGLRSSIVGQVWLPQRRKGAKKNRDVCFIRVRHLDVSDPRGELFECKFRVRCLWEFFLTRYSEE